MVKSDKSYVNKKNKSLKYFQILKNYMKKTIFIAALVFAGIFSPQAQAEFSDVSATHKNFVAIKHLSDTSIIKGYEDGSFKPDKVVNRVEALKIILSSSNIIAEVKEESTGFSDVDLEQWFASYVMEAKRRGIVKGNPDGSFQPGREVKRVEFIKMMLETNRFKKEKWENQQLFADVPSDAWYTPYMNYVGKAGILAPTNNQLFPEKALTRAEVAEIMYLMKLIMNGSNNQFLITQSEHHMAQIEVYISQKEINLAKRSSELAYDLTQKALVNMPDNNVVLSAAKIAKAYDLLVDAFVAGLQERKEDSRALAELSKVKATEAWESDNSTQEIARHIKTRADEILNQL